MTARRTAYTFARLLGDVSAVLSGKPSRIVKRVGNKWIGRNIVSKLWLR